MTGTICKLSLWQGIKVQDIDNSFKLTVTKNVTGHISVSMESSEVVPQKIKSEATVIYTSHTSGYLSICEISISEIPMYSCSLKHFPQ
jgi:hypothetical protein